MKAKVHQILIKSLQAHSPHQSFAKSSSFRRAQHLRTLRTKRRKTKEGKQTKTEKKNSENENENEKRNRKTNVFAGRKQLVGHDNSIVFWVRDTPPNSLPNKNKTEKR